MYPEVVDILAVNREKIVKDGMVEKFTYTVKHLPDLFKIKRDV